MLARTGTISILTAFDRIYFSLSSTKRNIIVGVENAEGSSMAKSWRDLWLLPAEVGCVGAAQGKKNTSKRKLQQTLKINVFN